MKPANLSRLIALLMLPVLCIGLAACGGDDDDEPDSKDPIVGTWYYEWDYAGTKLDYNTYYRFDENGTGAYVVDTVSYMAHNDRFLWHKVGKNSYVIDYASFSDTEDEENVLLFGDNVIEVHYSDAKGDYDTYRKK